MLIQYSHFQGCSPTQLDVVSEVGLFLLWNTESFNLALYLNVLERVAHHRNQHIEQYDDSDDVVTQQEQFSHPLY